MKIRVIQLLAVVSICGMIFVGCSKDEKKDLKKSGSEQAVMTNIEEYTKAKNFIRDYFKELYKENTDVSDMHKRSYFGEVPENVHSFIDQEILSDGLNSPDIPIHLPRFIELNGYTVVGYKLLEKNGEPQIDTTIIEEENGNTKYFTKIDFVTTAVRNSDFDLYYQKAANQEFYNKGSEVPADKIDNMKIRLKYDVVLKKDAAGFKVLAQTESNIKSQNKYRVLKFNNSFADRLPYLDTSLTSDNKPVNEDEKNRFETESELIKGFFESMINLDKNKMNYVEKSWSENKDKFNEMLEKYKIQKLTGGKALVLIEDDYKTKFAIDNFTLQDSMVKIIKTKSINIQLHPSYTQKVNNYLVNIDVQYQRMNGSSQDVGEAKYLYDVGFTTKDNQLMISSINLVEFKIDRKDTSSVKKKK